jgi:hypothetical protein
MTRRPVGSARLVDASRHEQEGVRDHTATRDRGDDSASKGACVTPWAGVWAEQPHGEGPHTYQLHDVLASLCACNVLFRRFNAIRGMRSIAIFENTY